MLKTSVPGKSRDGYILLDVLVALVVVSIGFGSVFVALTSSIRLVRRQEETLKESIEHRNQREYDFEQQICF